MTNITLDEVLNLAEQLSPGEQAELIAHFSAQGAHPAMDGEWCTMLDQMCGGADDDPM
jgi:hypothetical protein